MDLEIFAQSPVGRLIPIDGYDPRTNRRYQHAAFVPDPLPSKIQISQETYAIVGDAERALGRSDGATDRLPNPLLLARPALRQEAVSTSALEGTYAPLVDVFEGDYVESDKRSAEVNEILNYVRAAEAGFRRIRTRPISLNLIAPLQQILVEGTRGDGFDAGQLRQRQVFIAQGSANIEDSRFVPPPPGQELIDGVSAWEKWVNGADRIPLMVKIALAHYQFETLHPFSDGNGRLGRLIVALQLVDAGALRYPLLNLSPWLEPRRTQYQDLMLDLSLLFNPLAPEVRRLLTLS